MFHEQQTSILEWFLKDHVTDEIFHTKFYILQYYYFYYIFDQIIAALVSRRDFKRLSNTFKKNLTDPKFLNHFSILFIFIFFWTKNVIYTFQMMIIIL